MCTEKSEPPVTEAMYRHIFHKDFNLHFHSPRKDTCTKCDTLKMKLECEENPEVKEQYRVEHSVHLRKAEKARTSMMAEKNKAIVDPSVYTFSFDLEKALPFPTLTCSMAYYKRNCYVYNFGCHELSTDRGYMYLWDETMASRGSQEISSCIRKHVSQRAVKKQHIIAYSDACTGQNRNIKTSLMWIRLMGENESIKVIDHKFLVSGHSFLPNDHIGHIELKAKNKIMYVPDDWYTVIKKARSKHAFHVYQMQRVDFFSSYSLEKVITNRKKNTDGQPVNWLKIQWLRFRRDSPYKIFYKETIDEEFPFSCINITPATKGRPPNIQDINLEPLNKDVLPVSDLKKRDMLSLLQFIPPVRHLFFTSLKSEKDMDDQGFLDVIEESEETV